MVAIQGEGASNEQRCAEMRSSLVCVQPTSVRHWAVIGSRTSALAKSQQPFSRSSLSAETWAGRGLFLRAQTAAIGQVRGTGMDAVPMSDTDDVLPPTIQSGRRRTVTRGGKLTTIRDAANSESEPGPEAHGVSR